MNRHNIRFVKYLLYGSIGGIILASNSVRTQAAGLVVLVITVGLDIYEHRRK